MKRNPTDPRTQSVKSRQAPIAVAAPQIGVVRKGRAKPTRPTPQTDAAVIAFMRDLEHPLKAEIEAIREIVLGVSPTIHEEIKWNAPSFRTTEHFATFSLRMRDRVRLILHTGATVNRTATTGMTIADPAGMLEWLAADRCLVTFRDAKDIDAKRGALESVVRAWIRQV